MTERAVRLRRASNINDLPDEVLCYIISMIPIKEAVRASVLSKRWEHLFTLITNLDIEMDNYEEEELKRFMSFVDRLVFSHEIRSIIRLCLKCRAYIDPQRLDKWFCALVQHKIQQLDVRTDNNYDEFLLPASLFSIESLVVLNLAVYVCRRCDLIIPSRICLPHLKFIHFYGICFPIDGSEGRLFSSCPVLEDLVIERCFFGEGCINFSISNQNLKTLTLNRIDSDDERVVSILIKAPSLACLKYYFSRSHSPVLVDVKSLVEAVIDSDWQAHYVNENTASDVLRGIQNIKSLQIRSGILQDLLRHNIPIPYLAKMTCLEILDWAIESHSNGLEYFLTHCVVLETLKLKEMSRTSWFSDDVETGIEYSLRESQLICLLSHLKTVEIEFHLRKWADTLMAIFEFFLKNGKVLEELKIRGDFKWPQDTVMFMRELLSFPRVSENCRVTYLRQ